MRIKNALQLQRITITKPENKLNFKIDDSYLEMGTIQDLSNMFDQFRDCNKIFENMKRFFTASPNSLTLSYTDRLQTNKLSY